MVQEAFEWNLMRSFLAVVREGSLGRAAALLGTSQPSLGRHVKQLEEQLGLVLFERHARRLVPTSFALALAQRATAMVDGAAQVAELLAEQRAEATGTVRISASRMTATHLLPPILAELGRAHAGPTIELCAEDALSNLGEREADIAVRLVLPRQPSLVARRVGALRFGIYAARAYLKRHGTPRSLDDLAAHVVVGVDRSPVMLRGARRLGLSLAHDACRFRSDDRVVHWAAIRAGVGIGVLPCYLAEREPGLVLVLPEQRLAPSGVWLVATREVLHRPHVRALFDALRAGLVAALA